MAGVEVHLSWKNLRAQVLLWGRCRGRKRKGKCYTPFIFIRVRSGKVEIDEKLLTEIDETLC